MGSGCTANRGNNTVNSIETRNLPEKGKAEETTVIVHVAGERTEGGESKIIEEERAPLDVSEIWRIIEEGDSVGLQTILNQSELSPSDLFNTKGQSVLHHAAACGNSGAISLIMDANIPTITPDILNSRLATPLHTAVSQDQLEPVKLLISYGADANIEDENGQTPLLLCSILGRVEILKCLLELNKSGKLTEPLNVNAKDRKGLCPLNCSAIKGDLDICKMLLEEGKANVNELSPKRCSALIYAARGGYHKIVEELLRYKPQKNHQDASGATALHHSCEKNMHLCVQILLDQGADAEVQDMLGRTPLFEAVTNNAVAALPVLIEHSVEMNAIDFLGHSALFYAAKEGNETIVKLLVEKGNADVNSYSMPSPTLEKEMLQKRHEDEGLSRLQLHALNTSRAPLHAVAATITSKCELIDYLVQKGARINEPGRHNNTALHIAAFAGNIPAAIRLIHCGIDAALKNSKGMIAMELISKYYPSHQEEINEACRKQAKPEVILIEGELEEEQDPAELSIASEALVLEDPRIGAISLAFGEKVAGALLSTDKKYKGFKYIMGKCLNLEKIDLDLANVLLGVVTLALEDKVFKINMSGVQLMESLITNSTEIMDQDMVERHGVVDILFFRATNTTDKLLNRILDVIPKIGDLPKVGIDYLVMKCMINLTKSLGAEAEEIYASKRYKVVNIILQIILKVIDSFGPDAWPAKDLESLISSIPTTHNKALTANIQQMMTILKESNLLPSPIQVEEKQEISPVKKTGGVEEPVLLLQAEVEKLSEMSTEEVFEQCLRELLVVLAEKNIMNYLTGVDIASVFIARAMEFCRPLLVTNFIELIAPILSKIDSSNKRVKAKTRGLALILWEESIKTKDNLHSLMATFLLSPEQHKIFPGAMELFNSVLGIIMESVGIIGGLKTVESGLGVELNILIKLTANELSNKFQQIRQIATNLLIKCSELIDSTSDYTRENLLNTLEIALQPITQNIRERVVDQLNKNVADYLKQKKDKTSPEKVPAEEEKGGLIYAEPLNPELKEQLAPLLKYFSEKIVESLYSQFWSARYAGLQKIKEEMVHVTLGETKGKEAVQRNVNISAVPMLSSIEPWKIMLKHILDDPVIKIFIEGVDIVKEMVTLMRKFILNGEEVMKVVDPLVVTLIDKLNDQKIKIREKSIELLVSMLKEEQIQPFYLSEKLMNKFEESKGSMSANQLGSILRLIEECVTSFKLSSGNQKTLSQYMQLLNTSLKHSVSSIRSQAESLYLALYKLHGESINVYIVNQKPAIMKKLLGLVGKDPGSAKKDNPIKPASSSGITTLRNLVESGGDSLLSSEDPMQRIQGLIGIKKYIVKQMGMKEITSEKAQEMLEELSMLMRTILNDTNPEVYGEALKLLKFALNQLLKKLTAFDLQISVNTIITILIPKTISTAHHKIQISTDKFIISLGKESLIGPGIIIKNIFSSIEKLASEYASYYKSMRMSSSQSAFNRTGFANFDPAQNISTVMRYLGVAGVILTHYRIAIAHSKDSLEKFCDIIFALWTHYSDKVQIKECVYPIAKEILMVDGKAFEAILTRREPDQRAKISDVIKTAFEIIEEEQSSVPRSTEKRRTFGSKGFSSLGSPQSTLPSVYPTPSGMEEQKSSRQLPSYSRRISKGSERKLPPLVSTSQQLPPLVTSSQQLPPLVLKKNTLDSRKETPSKVPIWLGKEEERKYSLTGTDFAQPTQPPMEKEDYFKRRTYNYP